MTTTPQHCPGYANFKNLKSFTCKCSTCGEEKEIFSDEFDRTHTCASCGKAIDFTTCQLTGEAGGVAP
jgi:ribosomal protein S27E